uniref:Uncharacterized protein n=1 Tax=Anopheles farauti TaxID=69004 RepID=A0A182R1F0_9DIPT
MDPFGELQPCSPNVADRSPNLTPAAPSAKPGDDTPTTPVDPEQQQEKTDCTPENSKKSDSSPEGATDGRRVLPGDDDGGGGGAAKSLSLQEMLKMGRSVSEEPEGKKSVDEADSVRNAFAFTIDFGEGRKAVDSQRHEKMLERFQARHKRGVSLSKLESSSSTSTQSASGQRQQGSRNAPASVNLPRRNKAPPAPYESQSESQTAQQMVLIDDATGRPVAVKLREKNQRTVGRDQQGGGTTTKRHSWSPRTSVSEPMAKATGTGRSVTNASNRYAPKSATLALALEQQQQKSDSLQPNSYPSSAELNAESLDSSGIGIPCLEAPLENFRKTKRGGNDGGADDDDDDEVSEAGTYTIDGANYTEEQKERMNIDRLGYVVEPIAPAPRTAVRPTDFREELEVIDLERGTSGGRIGSVGRQTSRRQEADGAETRKRNVLEVSYFHEPPAPAVKGAATGGGTTKSKQSYIEKLKTRMKNITQKGSHSASSGDRAKGTAVVELDSSDQGTFTSVTTSGILSVKPTLLEGAVKHQRRRNSLTKSHIDSSEYVQGVAKLNIHTAVSDEPAGMLPPGGEVGREGEELKILNCYTDSEKAHQGGDQLAANSGQSKKVPPVALSPVSGRRKGTPSDVAALTTVATKKDWIQEWAKNAREYSKSTSPKVHPYEPPPATGGMMTRSYGGGGADYDGSEPTSHQTHHRSRSNQFGYDFDIDLTKSDYYEAKKYDEFGDNLDHRQQQQQQQQLYRTGGGSTSSAAAGVRNLQHQLPTTSPEELPYAMNEFARTGSRSSMRRYGGHPPPATAAAKPPMSPSKIPSPIGSIGRARSVSRNRSLQGSNSDLSGNETEMYLQKTAAAISTLQNLQRRNSLRNSSSHHSSSPLSPASRKMSPKVSPMNSLHSPIHSPGHLNYGDISSPLYSPQHQHHHQQQQQRSNLHHHQLHQNIGLGGGHKRNHSLDAADPLSSPTSYLPNGASGAGGGHMTRSLNTATTSPKLDFTKRHHTRHNSYEGVMSSLPPKPVKCFQPYDQPSAVGGYQPHGADVGVDDLDDPDDCRDYDEEEFEDDIDDDEDEEEIDLDGRRADFATTDGAMPRPRAMSLGPRKTPASSVQQQQQQQLQHLPTSTGAKQAMATNMKNVGGVSRVQKMPQQQQHPHLTSPIKRSSSFSVKANVMKPATPTMVAKAGGLTGVNGRTVAGGASRIQKSASSTSFKKMVAGTLDNGVQPQQYHHHSVQPPHHRHQLVMDPNFPDELMLYINDGDDDGLQMRGADRRPHDGYSSNSLSDEDEQAVDDLDDEDLDGDEAEMGARLEKEPLTNTRYNKTFLMRMEQNKKLAAGGAAAQPQSAGANVKQGGGAAACPNTPELPRRSVQIRGGVGGLGRDRASMPRDSSLNRMKQDLNLRKTSTGREMLLGGRGQQQQQSTQSIQSTTSSAAGAGGKVQPKYLDISKYKSSNAANFLKKDESKSYLLRQEGVRKSPSSASVSSAMSRTDPTRMSARSIKSAGSAASKSSGSGAGGAAGGGGAGAAAKKDPVKIAKEQELEMWRRRASYDPMKAALEGKKKQLEESRRLQQQQQQHQQQMHSERQSKSSESSVLRSQSYHSGVGNIGGGRLYQGNVGNSSNVNLRGAYNQTLGEQPENGDDNRWTLTSTESSEDFEGDDYIN